MTDGAQPGFSTTRLDRELAGERIAAALVTYSYTPPADQGAHEDLPTGTSR